MTAQNPPCQDFLKNIVAVATMRLRGWQGCEYGVLGCSTRIFLDSTASTAAPPLPTVAVTSLDMATVGSVGVRTLLWGERTFSPSPLLRQQTAFSNPKRNS